MNKEIISLTSSTKLFYLDYTNNKILDDVEAKAMNFDVMSPPKGICQILLRMYKLKDVPDVVDKAINEFNSDENYKKLFIISGQIFDNTIRTEDFPGNSVMFLGLKII